MTDSALTPRPDQTGINQEVLNLCTSTLLECITDSDERGDGSLSAYLPHLRAIAKEMQAFGGTYRDDVPGGENSGDGDNTNEAETETEKDDAERLRERHHTLRRWKEKGFKPVSLMSSDTPEYTLRLMDSLNSLMELITWLSENHNEVMDPLFPALTDIASEATDILGVSATNLLLGEEEAPQGYYTYLDMDKNTERLADLSVALMTCISEISRSGELELKVLVDDLLLLAREVIYAFSASAGRTLPVEQGFY